MRKSDLDTCVDAMKVVASMAITREFADEGGAISWTAISEVSEKEGDELAERIDIKI